MPGYDRSGPMGQGSMSGRGAGRCSGSDNENNDNARGYGMGPSRGGRGRRRGRGFRGGRCGWGFGPIGDQGRDVATSEDLRAEADFLRGRLNAIEQRLAREDFASE